MSTQFSSTPQIKTRTAVLVFIKGASAPIVLYVENPQSTYEEIQQLLKTPSAIIYEKDGVGPLKKISIISNQISAVALQEEQYV